VPDRLPLPTVSLDNTRQLAGEGEGRGSPRPLASGRTAHQPSAISPTRMLTGLRTGRGPLSLLCGSLSEDGADVQGAGRDVPWRSTRRGEASGRMPQRPGLGRQPCLSVFSWSLTAAARTGWPGSGPPRWVMNPRRPQQGSLPGTTSTATSGCPTSTWSTARTGQRPGRPRPGHLVPRRAGRQDGQEPAASGHPRQRRAQRPARDAPQARRR
jgi:hypothetical protein